MGDQIASSFSKLVPLIVLLLAIFGTLIAAAVFVRMRIQRDSKALAARRRSSPAALQAGDVVQVLGKSFLVTSRSILPDQATAWCSLKGDETECRLAFLLDLTGASYFPGTGDPPGDVFPQAIERTEGIYRRESEPASLGDDWKLAFYKGPGEKSLVLEQLQGRATLWRGKTIPPDGIRIIEDRPA